MVTCAVAVPPHPFAVIVYVVRLSGRTAREPGVGTPPTPLSITAEFAFVTAPQFSVAESPRLISPGLILNNAI